MTFFLAYLELVVAAGSVPKQSGRSLSNSHDFCH